MEKEFSKRKHPRLKNYDYSSSGAYFVTVCTHNRKCVLSRIVGRGLVCAFKSLTTKKCKEVCFIDKLFQTSFYEHIIRNDTDYNEIYNYIYENPIRWKFDQLFKEE